MSHAATALYLPRLLAGDLDQLRTAFVAEPLVEDPQDGRIAGTGAFTDFARRQHEWLVAHAARVEPLRTTVASMRAVAESLLHFRDGDGERELPVAVVGDVVGDRVRALRVYHSFWPLEGRHRVRPPLLEEDRSLRLFDVVADYQRALAAGDVTAIVSTFEADGYFREPAGGEFIYRGHDRLRELMSHFFGAGGIRLEHCTVTDDGVACAIEFNAIQFGQHVLQPQSGVAVYERGRTGKLCAARIYDDVNAEALMS